MKKDALFIGVAAAVFVVGALAVGSRMVSSGALSGPPVVGVSVDSASPDGPTVQFLGDTMLGDAAEPVLAAQGYSWALNLVEPMVDADVVIANGESPLTTSTAKWGPDKPYSYQASPEAARALAEAGITVMGLANNHAMDRGPEGLADTQANLAAAGIASFGAGATIDEARRPLVIDAGERKIAVVGFGEYFGRSSAASARRPGVVVMGPQTIDDAFRRAKDAGADDVVAYVHWGDNYQEVNDAQRGNAALFAEAGYRMVIGAGPHIAQPMVEVDGMPVMYSLGNFVFGANGRFAKFGKPGFGISATTQWLNDGSVKVTMSCLITDNSLVKFQPRPCTAGETRQYLPTVNPQLAIAGTSGTLTLPPIS
jgi:hypothetical protein